MTAEQRPAPSPLFGNRNFVIVWAGQFVSRFGDSLAYMGFLFFILYRLHGTALDVGKMMIAASVPSLLLGPVAGVFVDRWPRRAVMIISDVLRGLLFLLAPLMTALWQVYVLVFLATTLSRFFGPARMALLPDIVQREQLVQANSFTETTYQLLGVLAPAAGAALVAAVGYRAAFIGNGLSFVISAASILLVRVKESIGGPENAPGPAGGSSFTGVIRGFQKGLAYALDEPFVRFVALAGAAIMLGAGSVNVLFMPFLKEVRGFSIGQLGLGQSFEAAGGILGAAGAAILVRRLTSRTATFGAVSAIGLVLVALVTVTGVVPTYFLLAVTGAGAALMNIPLVSGLQRKVPPEMRGRVFAVFSSIVEAAAIVSMGTAPGLAGLVGTASVLGVVGVYLAILGVTLWILARGLDFGDRPGKEPNRPRQEQTVAGSK